MIGIEQEIERAILAQKRWADLDNRMRDLIGSSQEYDKKISKYSVENQLRFRGNLVRFVVNDEYEYYRELLKYSRDHLMLFPYHLSDFVITGMRITPFQYYLSTMSQIIEQEKSYDTLPNFTAADCLRLLNIGRNQYIDIMNELRSTYRRFLGIGVKTRSARSLLPNKPNPQVPIEPWWFINAGYITEDDVRSMVTPAERSIIDRLVSPDGLSNQILACDLNEEHVRSLYLKGLIYLDVPIYDDDYIVVPPLEGFVMNRVTGDYFETLLYKIFVSIDQNTPVQELASILEIDIRLVKNAVSMYCRLKFAYKKNIYIDIEKCHPSWLKKLEEYKQMGINVCQQTKLANRTSTLSNRNISDFINELASAENFDHGIEVTDTASTLVSELTLETNSPTNERGGSSLNSPNALPSPHSSQPLNSLPNQTAKKIVFFYDSNLAAFLMMGNLSPKLKNHAVTMFEVGKLPDEWIDSLLEELSKIKGDTIEEDGYEPRRYYIHAIMLQKTIEFIRDDLGLASDANQLKLLDLSDQPASPEQSETQQTRVGLDLIRIESLSNLDSESCERFLKKNYQVLISVAPLNQDVRLSSSNSLPHLGPGSPLINSLWFRLYLYHITGHGPPSLLLLQGYRLSKLPEIFSQYDTLLVNHWNREPTCLSHNNNALNSINDALTYSPVLIQAYPIAPIGGNLINSEEKVFVALPIDSSEDQSQRVDSTDSQPSSLGSTTANNIIGDIDKIVAIRKLNQCMNLKNVCGYITLLRSAKSVRKIVKERGGDSSPNLFGNRSTTDSLEYSDLDRSNIPEQTTDETSESKKLRKRKEKDVSEEDELTLFDCHFGIPLFDRVLNEQVRSRIKSQNLCSSGSLAELVRVNSELNDKIFKFVEEFRINKEMEMNDVSNSDDQRHFFSFPDMEQFRSSVPRPAENLLFANGILTVYKDC